jgi:CBS domain containing-hemolysin-like protein
MTVVTAFWLTLCGAGLAALFSLFFSSLTYSLRDFSRPRLAEILEEQGRSQWFDRTVEQTNDLIFTTAIGRMLANLLILIFVLHALNITILHDKDWTRYLLGTSITAVMSLFCSVAVPHAISRHAGEKVIAAFVRFLHTWRALLLPATRLMRGVDNFVMRLAATTSDESIKEQKEDEIQKEILSAVEEGEEAGVVDETEREMIESVIQFRATSVGQIMTPRSEVIALDMTSSLWQVKQMLEESGHSRLPMYEGTLDKIVGILYARDLLKYLGERPGTFDIRSAIRAPYFVPESKPLRDLLTDFRLQKIHIAIVLDEYGGTAGLVTIEDLLEEIVGDISDEHEPAEPAMFRRITDTSADADARIYLDELNRLMGLTLPEDEGYDTLGGFLSTKLGKIPETGATFTHEGVKFTITDAEPQKVNRVRIELLPQPAETATNT